MKQIDELVERAVASPVAEPPRVSEVQALACRRRRHRRVRFTAGVAVLLIVGAVATTLTWSSVGGEAQPGEVIVGSTTRSGVSEARLRAAVMPITEADLVNQEFLSQIDNARTIRCLEDHSSLSPSDIAALRSAQSSQSGLGGGALWDDPDRVRSRGFGLVDFAQAEAFPASVLSDPDVRECVRAGDPYQTRLRSLSTSIETAWFDRLTEFEQSPEFGSPLDSWRECMAANGIPAADPTSFYLDQVQQTRGSIEAMLRGDDSAVPSARELELALAAKYADCLAPLADARRAARPAVQIAFTQEHRASIDRYLRDAPRLIKRLSQRYDVRYPGARGSTVPSESVVTTPTQPAELSDSELDARARIARRDFRAVKEAHPDLRVPRLPDGFRLRFVSTGGAGAVDLNWYRPSDGVSVHLWQTNDPGFPSDKDPSDPSTGTAVTIDGQPWIRSTINACAQTTCLSRRLPSGRLVSLDGTLPIGQMKAIAATVQ